MNLYMLKVEYIKEYVEPIYDLPIPEKGKAWRNKINGYIYTSEVILGKILYLDGKLLDIPIIETVDDYELIDFIINN